MTKFGWKIKHNIMLTRYIFESKFCQEYIIKNLTFLCYIKIQISWLTHRIVCCSRSTISLIKAATSSYGIYNQKLNFFMLYKNPNKLTYLWNHCHFQTFYVKTALFPFLALAAHHNPLWWACDIFYESATCTVCI